MPSRFRSLLAVLALVVPATPAAAFELAGVKQITLKASDGAEFHVGSVSFTPEGGKTGFTLAIDTAKFKDFFLSMREFKCLEGKEIQCYVPYPYNNPKTVSADDMRWLETGLIFMFKTASSFGATLSNGLYYELKPEGDALVGKARLVDLNQIAAPPANADEPPFPPDDRLDVEPGSRWLPELVIK